MLNIPERIEEITERLYEADVFEYEAEIAKLLDDISKKKDKDFQERLSPVLELILKAMQNKDCLLIADILKYELMPLAVEYKQMQEEQTSG